MNFSGRTPQEIERQVAVSMGDSPPDLMINNGNIVNVMTGEIYEADIALKDNRIVRVGDITDIKTKYPNIGEINCAGSYLIPGLIDTHLHTESTLLTPTSFTKLALPRGTTCAVVDPHEIGNVLGIRGLEIYIEEVRRLPIEFLVEIPSCVPAAPILETGANILTSDDYVPLVNDNRFFALAEMMNFPGVIYRDQDVMRKLSLAENAGLIIEGHAPALTGKDMQAYLTAGISSCHESIGVSEVVDKLRAGCKIQLREGSFARNLIELGTGIKSQMENAISPWDNVIICSDDRHADDLLDFGHLDHSLRLLVNEVGLDPVKAIQICTINPANHLLRPDLGAIAPGKIANIVKINNLTDFKVGDVISQGKHVVHDHKLLVDLTENHYPDWALNTVKPRFIPDESQFNISGPLETEEGKRKAHIIGVIEHSLITDHFIEEVMIENNKVVLENGLDYFFLLDRHGKTGNFSKSLVKGFNFDGNVAIASTVAHDSHQLLIIGNNSRCMYYAMKELLNSNGGQSIVIENDRGIERKTLPLPYAGLMSIDKPELVAEKMKDMKEFSQKVVMGISEPFMSLSFLALPVIPSLKLTDKGLVDVNKFEVIELFDN